MRIEDINTRLAAIAQEVETATGEDLSALETEVTELTAERQRILDEAQTRQQLRDNIAAGIVAGETIIEKHEEENIMENRTFTLESEEYRSAFLHNLRRENMSDVETRAFTFLTSNTTAPLPTVMQNRIIDLIGEAHPIVADVFRLDSGTTIAIPVAKAVKADAGQSAEGAAANELEIEFTDVNLGGDDYTALVKMSYKMVNMSIDAFETYLVTQISERMGSKLAADIVANIKAGVAEENKVATGVNYANLCTAFGELKRVGALVLYGTRAAIYNKLVGMVDSNKRPIFQNTITEAAAGALLGATVKFEDALGDTELLVGDPKKYYQNVVAPISVDRGKELDNSKVVFAGYTCQEGILTDPKAFALVSEA